MKEMEIQIPLDRYPDHAAAIGRLIGYWVFIESQIVLIMAYLLKTNEIRARLIFQSIISFSPKLKIIKRLAKLFLDDGDGKSKLLSLLEEAGKLSNERNIYVHSLWCSTEEKGIARVRTNPPKKEHEYLNDFKFLSLQDAKNEVERFSALARELYLFLEHDLPKLTVREEPLSPMQTQYSEE